MHTQEKSAIIRDGEVVSKYIVKRELGDGQEVFTFRSKNRLFKHPLERPYAGQLDLRLYVARVVINGLDDGRITQAYLELGGETSLYARSKFEQERWWAGANTTFIAIGRYLDYALTSSPKAEEFYNSFPEEQMEKVNFAAISAS